MAALTICAVSSAKEKKKFLHFPFKLYKDCKNWVPPLIIEMKEKFDSKRHPFYAHGEAAFFLALRDGVVVGRIAALVDRSHNEFHNEKAGGFGFFDIEEDREVASQLLQKAAIFCKDKGMTTIRGPFNYSTNEECAALVRGFDSPPVLMMPWNPPWYDKILQEAGLDKAMDLFAYSIDKNTPFERLARLSARAVKRNNLKVRRIDMSSFDQELEQVRLIYNSAWKNNWGFIPLSKEEFSWHAKKMKQVLLPDLALIVEVSGEAAGFMISLPDYNQVLKKMNGRLFPFGIFKFLLMKKRISNLRVVMMGITPEFRNLGAEAALIYETITTGLRIGFQGAELSWVLEDNLPMVKLAEKIGADPYKQYRIYEAPVERLAK